MCFYFYSVLSNLVLNGIQKMLTILCYIILKMLSIAIFLSS